MYYVLIVGSEETVAMTKKKDVAEMVAKFTKEECVIRYGEK